MAKRLKPGDVFYKFTLIRRIKEKSSWLAQCECGNTRLVRSGDFRLGRRKTCGCDKRHSKSHKIKPNNYALIRKVYRTYKNDAKKRSLLFGLSFEEVSKLIKQECHYCGTIDSCTVSDKRGLEANHRYFKYNGIDRVNNEIGYFIENCVPCCNICNYSKRTLSLDEWSQWIEKVYIRMKSRQLEVNV